MAVIPGWQGRFFEDSPWVTCTAAVWVAPHRDRQHLVHESHAQHGQVHFNRPFAERGPFGTPLVNSALTLALVTGLSVTDVSENAMANLAWDDIRLPSPVFPGDTLWCESEVLELRESASRPYVGIVGIRSRGINQRAEVVIEFRRTMMVYRRRAEQVQDLFPITEAEWRV